MSRVSLLRQDDFTGGLNLRADQFQLTNNESPRLLNVEIDPRGGVYSRGAMRTINSANIAANWSPRNLVPFYGSDSWLMLSTGKTVSGNGDIFYSTGGNFTSLDIDVYSENGASFAPWGKTLYMTGGKDAAQAVKWDGSTKTLLTANGPTWQPDYDVATGGHMPRAEHCIVHAGKLFVANTYEHDEDHPNRIRWSHPNKPEDWAELDRIDVTTGGDGITGLASFNGQLLIFKEHAVFALFGFDTDSFQVIEVSRTVGTLTPHGIATTEFGVYFFSHPDGLMFYNGQAMRDVFEPLRPAVDSGYISYVSRKEVYVSYINRRIWVSVPYSETETPTTATAVFVFDPSVKSNHNHGNGTWTMFSTCDSKGVAQGCSWIDSDGVTVHVAPHATQAHVLSVDLYESAQDNITGSDVPFVSRYRTRWLDAGSYSQKKMFRRPEVVVKQVETDMSIAVEVYGDYEEAEQSEIKSFQIDVPGASSGMIWGVSLWGVAKWGAANAGSQVTSGRTIGLARAVQLEFTNVVNGEAQPQKWGVNSYTLKYVPRKVKS